MFKEIFEKSLVLEGKEVFLEGWILEKRGNLKVYFLGVNDGSNVENVQLVFKVDNFSPKKIKEIDEINLGSSFKGKGIVRNTPNSKQKLEIIMMDFEVLGHCLSSFPIQKNEINLETLREMPHLRQRTKLFRAIMNIRSTLFVEIHKFLQKENFLYCSTPIITGVDGEGAGETFSVFSEESHNFFGKKSKDAKLGVTGQLHLESYANGFKKTYTFGPTFRAEKSNTPRHAAEFWMLEVEVSFWGFNEIIKFCERFLKFLIVEIFQKHAEELRFLDLKFSGGLVKKLEKFQKSELKIIKYVEAIEILQQNKDEFENRDIFFGLDLATEHEKFLSEKYFDGPVVIIDYPKDFKAFYMTQNFDGKTVSAFDLIVPGIGELIGGSQREKDVKKLAKRAEEVGIKKQDIEWYLSIRDFGSPGSSGFGLGFERLVMYFTGVENIRDSIPFPRVFGKLKM